MSVCLLSTAEGGVPSNLIPPISPQVLSWPPTTPVRPSVPVLRKVPGLCYTAATRVLCWRLGLRLGQRIHHMLCDRRTMRTCIPAANNHRLSTVRTGTEEGWLVQQIDSGPVHRNAQAKHSEAQAFFLAISNTLRYATHLHWSAVDAFLYPHPVTRRIKAQQDTHCTL